ncbi:hypothetical protein BpHYR1_036551 [Brachionus plicatilis]|uniref:Uncharacterized protein n=1 Tax=Brachionus plicatilis TaxID=10195 RepID=A0A3M7PZ10_BRAPC|nr:hypothetical protein BpHYR1_036551 [Brachionus plicatilis]
MCSGYWWSIELSLHPLRCLLLPERSPSSKWIPVVPHSWTWRPRRLNKLDSVSNSPRCFVYLTLLVVAVAILVVVAAVLFVVPVVLAVVVLVGVESQVPHGSYPLRQAVCHSRGCGYVL